MLGSNDTDLGTQEPARIRSDLEDIRQFFISFRVKCLCDLIASCLILIFMAPVLLLISILIKLDSPGPVFHKQDRVGLKGSHFRMWKFRTMVANASELQPELEAKNNATGGVIFKIKEDPRITRVGKFLRRYSLDELLQIINVLRGEMSIVGPRPLLLRDVQRFPEDMFFRHDVLPGITGLWQIKGRSSLKSEEVFYWDSIYIQKWSVVLDLSILLQTIIIVIQGDGSY